MDSFLQRWLTLRCCLTHSFHFSKCGEILCMFLALFQNLLSCLYLKSILRHLTVCEFFTFSKNTLNFKAALNVSSARGNVSEMTDGFKRNYF